MYYIYHIPNVKIGVSEEPHNRVKKQGYTDYKILEEHSCIYKVSDRELELQNKYGYRVDDIPYYKSRKTWGLNIAKKGGYAMQKKYPNTGKNLGEWARKKLSKVVLQYDLDGNLINEYPSMREAERQTGVKSIGQRCKGLRKDNCGFIWKYKEKNLDN